MISLMFYSVVQNSKDNIHYKLISFVFSTFNLQLSLSNTYKELFINTDKNYTVFWKASKKVPEM